MKQWVVLTNLWFFMIPTQYFSNNLHCLHILYFWRTKSSNQYRCLIKCFYYYRNQKKIRSVVSWYFFKFFFRWNISDIGILNEEWSCFYEVFEVTELYPDISGRPIIVPLGSYETGNVELWVFWPDTTQWSWDN